MSTDTLAFLNGRFVSPSELTLSYADAGFVFGATVTDFCRTYRHRLFHWPDHLARLRRDCNAIGISLPFTDAELTDAAQRLVEHHAKSLDEGDDLALITFATPGPLAYLTGAVENSPPTVGMHTLPLPKDRYRRFFTEGITLVDVGQLPEGTHVPQTVKHRSRLHWWLAERDVQRIHPGALALFTNAADGSADTAVGTVLTVIDDGVRLSPPGSVLESVSARVVEDLCEANGLKFERSGLEFRTEAMLVGSGFGIAGVRRWIGRDGTTEFLWPGPVLQKLTVAWSEMVGVDIVRQIVGEAS